MSDRAARKKERDAQLREFAPDSGLDRSAWSVLGQPLPPTHFSWGRALGGLGTVVVVAVLLVVLLGSSPTLPFSLAIAWAFFIWRAHGAWQRYEARRGAPPAA